MPRSPRASTRVNVMTQLKTIRTNLDRMRTWWTAETTIYIPPDQRPAHDPNAYLRPRQPHEYPEAQRDYWTATAVEAVRLIHQLDALRTYCIHQAALTPEQDS